MPAISDLDDEQLVLLLKQGREEALAIIYERYAKILIKYAAVKLYSLDDASDILHDLFLKLWSERSTLDIQVSLKSYLFSAIRYRIVDKIRRNITRQEYAAILQSLSQDHQSTLENQLDVKDLQQSVDRALEALPAKTREIYQLSRKHHQSVLEIAKHLNISEQTVKNQLTIALKHLRKALGHIGMIGSLIYWLKN